MSGNFLNEILYTNINLVEQFNPLLKIDMELKNSIRLVVALKKDRALSLSLDNDLLTLDLGFMARDFEGDVTITDDVGVLLYLIEPNYGKYIYIDD